MKIYADRLLVPGGWAEGMTVEIENGVIQSVGPGGAEECELRCGCLTPGLFDIHQHGGVGCSANHADLDKLREILRRSKEQLGVLTVTSEDFVW